MFTTIQFRIFYRSVVSLITRRLKVAKTTILCRCETLCLVIKEEDTVRVGFQVLTAASMKMTVFWDVAP
jgi:hypothetical protein